MNFVRPHKIFSGPAAIALAGLLALVTTLPAADSPTDAAAAPAPAPAPAAAPSGSWYVFSPPKEGVVLPLPMREKLLTFIKGFFDRSNPEQVAHLKTVPNPFYPILPPVQEPAAAVGGSAATPAVAAPTQISPVEKLQQVADQLKPTGALIGGQNRLIVFANGNTLAAGQAILVTFPGDSTPTTIVLQEVSSDSFTLKLGDTVKAFPYVAKGNNSRPSSPTTPSQPKP